MSGGTFVVEEGLLGDVTIEQFDTRQSVLVIEYSGSTPPTLDFAFDVTTGITTIEFGGGSVTVHDEMDARHVALVQA